MDSKINAKENEKIEDQDGWERLKDHQYVHTFPLWDKQQHISIKACLRSDSGLTGTGSSR
jgi:hypothetical protein